MADHFLIDVMSGKLVDELAQALARVEHPRALMQNIGGELESRILERFEDKTDPDGHAWLPLAASTLARKRKIGESTSLLVVAGYMREMHVNAANDWVEVGSAEPYAIFHETGTRKMPRRSFLLGDFNSGRLGAGDEASLLDVVNEYLSGSFGSP